MLALVLPAILFLIACGGSDTDDVEAAIRNYVDLYVASDYQGMYDQLDSGSQAACAEETFIQIFSLARESLGQRTFEIREIRNIEVEGDVASATVLVAVDDELGDPTQNVLHKEDGEWRLELPSAGCG